MFVGENESPFGTLPPELVVKILKFVGGRGNLETRRVCRRWQFINDHPDSELTCFRAGFIRKDKSFEKFLKSERQFERLYVGGKNKEWPSSLTLKYLPPVRILILGKALPGQTAMAFLQSTSEFLQSLQILESSLTHIKTDQFTTVLSDLKLENLTELNISVVAPSSVPDEIATKAKDNIESWFIQLDETHSAAVETFLETTTIPHIKKFTLTVQPCPSKMPVIFKGISPSFVPVVTKYTTFIERHATTLKEITLYINVCGSKGFYDLVQVFNEERQESIASVLTLQSLNILFANYESLFLVPPCLFLSNKLRSLKLVPTFEFTCSPHEFSVDKEQFAATILRNQETLVHLEISVDPDYFKLEWLDPCPRLTHLTLDDLYKVLTKEPEIRLPQVESLVLSMEHFTELFGYASGLIARAFKNLRLVKVTGLTATFNGQYGWIDNFLELQYLKVILYSFSCMEDLEETVEQFCQKRPRLRYHREGEIRVTPEN